MGTRSPFGMGEGYYLCGCTTAPRVGYDKIRVDSEGFIVCPEHGKRRYGWRNEQVRVRDTGPEGLKSSVESVLPYYEKLTAVGELLLEEREDFKWDKETSLSQLHDELLRFTNLAK